MGIFIYFNTMLSTVVLTILVITMFICCLKLVYLINKTTKYSNENWSLLFNAIANNDAIRFIRLIKNNPGLINIRHPADGYTTFMKACLMGRTQLVLFMLNNGANVSMRSPRSETPFYLAVYNLIQNSNSKDASCIRILYYAGCDINAPNWKGYTPLHLAVMFGHNSLVKWLLSKGATVAKYPDPYLLARFQGHYETAKLLRGRRLAAIEN